MGRDNEFRTYQRKEQAVVSKSIGGSLNQKAGAELRKHNFSFGFEDAKSLAQERLQRSVANKKDLYEQTKGSQQNNNNWIYEQLRKNRETNI